ncbi:MAG: DUF5717 family protein [Lachnospiraceae bacterium]|nr:DUF5717 family protein [Lachnospiraceae bacterium]
MEQLISGKWETEQTALFLSTEKIEETVAIGPVYEGSFTVGHRVRGFATADHPRLSLTTEAFEGTDVTIGYRVVTEGLAAGDTIEGAIRLVTSLGEARLPVRFTLAEGASRLLPENIRTLDDFTQLARSAYGEAYHMFCSPAFQTILENEKASLRTLYRGLTVNPVTYQRVEEFLTSAGKKAPVRVSLEKTEATHFNLKESIQATIKMTRNTWGHLNYRVEADGDFIVVSKKQLTDEDFVGSVAELPYIIKADRIKKGRRFGRIILKSAYETLVFAVTASRGAAFPNNQKLIFKKNIVKLAGFLLEYRLGRMDHKAFIAKSQILIAAMREMGELPAFMSLYDVYVRQLAEDEVGSRNLLRSLQENNFADESLEVKGAFLYLCHKANLLMPGRFDVVNTLRVWVSRQQESFVLLYLLMQVDDDLIRSPLRRLMLMEDLYGCGCRDPFMYIEALTLYREDSRLLRRLNRFTRAVLAFGAREGVLTKELADRLYILVDNERTFTPRVFRLLTKAYETFPSKTGIEAVCRFIMKGQPRKKEYFRWYAAAVDEGVRMTRLYEYYIETMPTTFQKRFPTAVRRYFTMNSSLGGRQLAFIYANVIRSRERDEATYQDYLPRMQTFAASSLIEGAMDENYGIIYSEFFRRVTDPVVGRALVRVMFMNKISCDDDRVREVVVRHPGYREEVRVPLKGGRAYVPIYTEGAVILFRDETGRRFASGVAYSRQKLMDYKALLADCLKMGLQEPGILLNVCAGSPAVTNENAYAFAALADDDRFEERTRLLMRRRLLTFLHERSGGVPASVVRQLDPDLYAAADRVKLTEVLIDTGLFAEALAVIDRCGPEDVALPRLLRLANALTETYENEDPAAEDFEALLRLARYVYDKGLYNERLLTLLASHMTADLEDLLSLRAHAEAFYLDTYGLDERLLLQAPFVQKRLPEAGKILASYRRHGGRMRIIRAYLTFEAADSFRHSEPMDGYACHLLEADYEAEREMPRICRLAILASYADRKTISDEEEARIDALLEEMTENGIRLAFFKRLPARCLAGYDFTDRVILEERAGTKDFVVLHYRMTHPGDDTGVWKSEPMGMVFPGIFVREFVLFTGETLHYYTTVEGRGESDRLSEGTRRLENGDVPGNSRYQLINRMLTARESRDEALLKETIRRYQTAAYRARTLFVPDEREED